MQHFSLRQMKTYKYPSKKSHQLSSLNDFEKKKLLFRVSTAYHPKKLDSLPLVPLFFDMS